MEGKSGEKERSEFVAFYEAELAKLTLAGDVIKSLTRIGEQVTRFPLYFLLFIVSSSSSTSASIRRIARKPFPPSFFPLSFFPSS